MRFIAHKREARWFYRFVSLGYDRAINPLFWTAEMRDAALELAELGVPGIEVVDVGAGTGFATTAIVRYVDPGRVTMLDQSPHQLARARRKPALDRVGKLLGDAEALPFASASTDRWVSTGSIEYWPEPQRAIDEAFRVLRPGGVALLAGPLRRAQPLMRGLSDAWMLFPPESEYRSLMVRAGFVELRSVYVAPPWWDARWDPYAIAIAGRKPADAPVPEGIEHALPAPVPVPEPLTAARLARFAAGSLAGAAFIPIAAGFELRRRLRER